MTDYTYKNVTVTGASTPDEARRQAVKSYLWSIAGPDAAEPTEQEIDGLLAELNPVETERLDLADLGRQVAAEIAWLDTTISGIDDYAAAQVRDVVKRLAQENRAILRALRFVVRRLA